MVNTLESTEQRVVVLGTGGTIAGRASSAHDNVGYVAGQVAVGDMLRGIEAPAGIGLVAEQVAQLDSKDMDFATWQALALRCARWLAEPDVAGIVVTHGTDTLEETAFFLQCVLAPEKPVVLACAMRPSTALAPDGPQNLRDAIAVAATPGASGVCAVCAGAVHGALDVRKAHTYRVDAFDSGDAGVLGYVEEGGLRRLRDWPTHGRETASACLEHVGRVPPGSWPRVEIVTSHAGASGRVVEALVRDGAQDAADPLRGIVIAASGNGTVHREIEAAASKARKSGVAVVRATRCANGRIVEPAGDGEAVQVRSRSAGTLTLVKARIALMLELLAAGAEQAPEPASASD